jgi:hypothetical protein
VGTYDKQNFEGTGRTMTCFGDFITEGALYVNADQTWTKVDLGTTPGGSVVCGGISGTWVRADGNTLVITPGTPSFPPTNATLEGDVLTFPEKDWVYRRRIAQ